jgi:hypothetical protein
MLAGKAKIKFGLEVRESTRYRVIELPDTNTLDAIKSGEPYNPFWTSYLHAFLLEYLFEVGQMTIQS